MLYILQTVLLFINQGYQDNNFVVPISICCFSAVVEILGSNSACDLQKLTAYFAYLLPGYVSFL